MSIPPNDLSPVFDHLGTGTAIHPNLSNSAHSTDLKRIHCLLSYRAMRIDWPSVGPSAACWTNSISMLFAILGFLVLFSVTLSSMLSSVSKDIFEPSTGVVHQGEKQTICALLGSR